MTHARIVFTTLPSAEQAAALARTLVEEGLAACGNVVPAVRSIYRWQGKLQDDAEALLLLKTRADLVAALESRLRELHPYEVPELLAVAVDAGFRGYLDWIEGSTLRAS